MRIILELFFTCARIGMFTFGGGYAMLSLIEDICVEKKKWITHEEMMDITVIAESTPGPVAINCATYVGYKHKKLPGAIAATIGMVLPSFCIIFLISKYLDEFLEIAWIANAFRGIKIAVGILITDAAVRLFLKAKKQPFQVVIMIISLIAMIVIDIFALRISSLIIMLAAALTGMMVYMFKNTSDEVKEK